MPQILNNLPKEIFEKYENEIFKRGLLISRDELSKIFPFIAKKTLRNWDSQLCGIGEKIYINNRVYYLIEEVISFLKEKYCEKEEENTNKLNGKDKYHDQKKSKYTSGFSYRQGVK